jgi:hypothetical protein
MLKRYPPTGEEAGKVDHVETQDLASLQYQI